MCLIRTLRSEGEKGKIILWVPQWSKKYARMDRLCKIFFLLSCLFCLFLVWFINRLDVLSGMCVYFYLSKTVVEVLKLIRRIYSHCSIHSSFHLSTKILFLTENPNYPRFTKKTTGAISVTAVFQWFQHGISHWLAALYYICLWDSLGKAGGSELARGDGGTLGVGQSDVVLDITNNYECSQRLSSVQLQDL